MDLNTHYSTAQSTNAETTTGISTLTSSSTALAQALDDAITADQNQQEHLQNSVKELPPPGAYTSDTTATDDDTDSTSLINDLFAESSSSSETSDSLATMNEVNQDLNNIYDLINNSGGTLSLNDIAHILATLEEDKAELNALIMECDKTLHAAQQANYEESSSNLDDQYDEYENAYNVAETDKQEAQANIEPCTSQAKEDFSDAKTHLQSAQESLNSANDNFEKMFARGKGSSNYERHYKEAVDHAQDDVDLIKDDLTSAQEGHSNMGFEKSIIINELAAIQSDIAWGYDPSSEINSLKKSVQSLGGIVSGVKEDLQDIPSQITNLKRILLMLLMQ